jgi:hypothetical protein
VGWREVEINQIGGRMPRHDFERATNELDAIEAELTKRLCAKLKEVSAGNGTLFFITTEHNPGGYPDHWRSKTSDELLDLANASIDLRKLLVLPIEKCVGQLFINACDESSEMNNPHRLGPIRQAAKLLAEIENLQRAAS